MGETVGKPTAKKVSGCGWWMPAEATPFGPKPIDGGERYDSPYKARKEAARLLAALSKPSPIEEK